MYKCIRSYPKDCVPATRTTPPVLSCDIVPAIMQGITHTQTDTDTHTHKDTHTHTQTHTHTDTGRHTDTPTFISIYTT